MRDVLGLPGPIMVRSGLNLRVWSALFRLSGRGFPRKIKGLLAGGNLTAVKVLHCKRTYR